MTEHSTEDNKVVPNISNLKINPEPQHTKKESVALRLELKKAYDYSPPSDLPNKRYILGINI